MTRRSLYIPVYYQIGKLDLNNTRSPSTAYSKMFYTGEARRNFLSDKNIVGTTHNCV